MSDADNHFINNTEYLKRVECLQDPDCLSCLRQKLRAISVVVFFKEKKEWRVGAYQADKPQEDAEIDFYCMLKAHVPENVFNEKNGLLLNDVAAIGTRFGALGDFLKGNCLIGAPVRCGPVVGARLAWRDASDPFSAADLELIRCSGKCPER